MNQDIIDAVTHLLGDHCSSAVIQRIEAGQDWRPLWDTLESSGFTDALVSEAMGGAGLSPTDALGIAICSGQHALPLPWAHTMVARGLLALHGVAAPSGPIAIAEPTDTTATDPISVSVPWGRVADHAVVHHQGQHWLLPAGSAEIAPSGGPGGLDAQWTWPSWPSADAVPLPDAAWTAWAAVTSAALMAGALEWSFELSMQYANERIQFGKPISKIQVIQQQLSVMAEHVFAARMAAQIGWHSPLNQFSLTALAVAKQRTSEAVTVCAPIAHAVHGAMGFTAEYALQLRTRRLHEWRLHYGSEQHWARWLGEQWLAHTDDALGAAMRVLEPQ